MKNKNVHAVEMTREIRDKDASLYWEDKREYLKKVKEAAKKLQAIRLMKKVHST